MQGSGRAEAGKPVALPALSAYRYDEDYSFLKDEDLRSHAEPLSLAPLKYVRLGSDSSNYLSVGSEVRLRYEYYKNNQWGQGPQDHGGYVWGRLLPYADLHIGPYFRAFAQAIAAYEWGDAAGVSPPDEDQLDLLQGFIDVRLPAGDKTTLLVRGGRQLLHYGSERLIGLRYGPNVPQPFDAVLLRLEHGPWRVDAFYARPVEIGRGTWDDEADDTQDAWSLYATRALPLLGEGSGVDVYYIGYRDDRAAFAQGEGRERRHTVGVRWFGAAAGYDWNCEGFYQFGSFDNSSANGEISAWSLASSSGYTFGGARLQPRIGLKANVISGDDDAGDPDLQTFNALFPKGKYFGEIGLLGPYNLVNVHPTLLLNLTGKLTLDVASVFYWRYSTHDGIYDNAGNVIRDGADSGKRFIGSQLEALFTYAFIREIEASASYSVFIPGSFIDDTGPGKVVQFVGLEVGYKF